MSLSLAAREDIRLSSRDLGDGLRQTELSVPGMRCGGCMGKIEKGLGKVTGVEHARVNLSSKRVSVTWRGDAPPDLPGALAELGFPAHLTEPDVETRDPELAYLIRALAVAGFSSMNIMLLSVSVWSGADPSTRHAFHWISAALALPCLLYSGWVFFRSAWSALRHGRTNMDVPISVGVILAFGLSLYDTLNNGPHAYFDAATSLIFFLLIGRTLDHVMREKARAAVRGLARLSPRGAVVLNDGGGREHRPIEDLAPGMRVLLAAGDRVPVDGRVEGAPGDLDCAIVTGESAPRRVTQGDAVPAGALNLSGPLVLTVSARAQDSFLAEMVRLMEAAEGGRALYRRLADRAAALYSPVIHSAAFLTFLGWMIASGDAHRAITIAIAVLIITCPCALGLAVPMVQITAARRLFDNGVMVRDGSALERMDEIDTVVFDKTGTLTLGKPRLSNRAEVEPDALALAAALARNSNHPLSRAIAAEVSEPQTNLLLEDVVEHPGLGVEARLGDSGVRLGRMEWAMQGASETGGTVLTRDGRMVARFQFQDALRPGARAAADALRASGLKLVILSGDEPGAVAAVAADLGVDDAAASLMPVDKVTRLTQLSAEGRKVLMVGDGLNDAPALAAAHVSMAPATAADVGRNAADFVFLHDGLDAVPTLLAVSRESGRLVRQNFGLSVLYNIIAVPIAVAGFVTPLIAALAMSLSSIVVVANALRLKAGRRGGAQESS